MTQIPTLVAAAAIAALATAAPALAQSGGKDGAPMSHAMPMTHAMPKASDRASTRDFKAADVAMMRNMRVPYTDDADVDFRTHMIPHHRGAIDMAKVALQHARDPATKALAEAIIKDQEREIAEMQAWLKAHGR